MASLRVTFVVAIMCLVVVSAPIAEAATCGQLVDNLIPCITYLQGGAGPSPQCCGGVRKLNAAANTGPARKQACNCLKSAAGTIAHLNNKQAASLPGKCGVNIPYKFSTSTNCNSIRF